MSSKSPEKDLLRPTPLSTSRINRQLLIACVGVALILIAVSLTIGLAQPTKTKPKEAGQSQDATIEQDHLPDAMQKLPHDYSHMGKSPPPPEPSPEPSQDEASVTDSFLKANQQREEQENLLAMRSPMVVSQSSPSSIDTGNAHSSSTALTDTSVESMGTNQSVDSSAIDADMAQNMQPQKQAFLDKGISGKGYASSAVVPPKSPYQIMAGTIIPASLITGIKSDLPGLIIAQVREHVYDTRSGHTLLIPQGSRLIGHYDSLLSYGQNRLLLVWNQLVFPNGSSLELQNLTASDLSGYAGLSDKVDYHLLRLAGGMVLSSILSVGIAASEDANTNSLAQAIAGNLADDANTTGQKIIDKQLNLQPTITIRPGYSLNIFVNQHLILQPYRET